MDVIVPLFHWRSSFCQSIGFFQSPNIHWEWQIEEVQDHVECAKEVCASWSLSDITRRQSSNTPTSSALRFDILVVSGTLSQVLYCTSSERPLVNALNRHPNPKGQTEMSHFLPNSNWFKCCILRAQQWGHKRGRRRSIMFEFVFRCFICWSEQ